MNRIDKLFKDKLSHKGLTYTDQHWVGMEELLEINKKVAWYSNRKLIAVLALLAGGILASTYWWINDNIHAQTKKIPLAKNSLKIETPRSKIQASTVDSSTYFIPLSPNLDFLPFTFSNYSLPFCGGDIYTDDFLAVNYPLPLPQTKPFYTDILKSKKVNLEQAFSISTYHKIPELVLTKKWNLYVGAYYNTVNYGKILSSELQQKTESQQAMPSNQFGLQVRLQNKNWSIVSGIGQTNLYEQTNFVTTETTWQYSTRYRLVQEEYTETPRGKKVSLIKKEIDSLGTTNTRVDCPNCETKISYIDIPISVQYELNRNRFVAFGKLGLQMAILQKAEGLYAVELVQKPTMEETDITILPLHNNLDYLSPTLWQAQANIGLKYRITNQWAVWGNYGRAQSINSMMTKYKQQNKFQQIGLGVEYKLK